MVWATLSHRLANFGCWQAVFVYAMFSQMGEICRESRSAQHLTIGKLILPLIPAGVAVCGKQEQRQGGVPARVWLEASPGQTVAIRSMLFTLGCKKWLNQPVTPSQGKFIHAYASANPWISGTCSTRIRTSSCGGISTSSAEQRRTRTSSSLIIEVRGGLHISTHG